MRILFLVALIFFAQPAIAQKSPFNDTPPPGFGAEPSSEMNALIEALTRRTIAEEHAITRDSAGYGQRYEKPAGSTNSFSESLGNTINEAFRNQAQDYQYKKSLADSYQYRR